MNIIMIGEDNAERSNNGGISIFAIHMAYDGSPYDGLEWMIIDPAAGMAGGGYRVAAKLARSIECRSATIPPLNAGISDSCWV
ncbi:MAG: hypothetical protein WD449_00185 [Candidatus Babeliales bacterium]